MPLGWINPILVLNTTQGTKSWWLTRTLSFFPLVYGFSVHLLPLLSPCHNWGKEEQKEKKSLLILLWRLIFVLMYEAASFFSPFSILPPISQPQLKKKPQNPNSWALLFPEAQISRTRSHLPLLLLGAKSQAGLKHWYPPNLNSCIEVVILCTVPKPTG